MQPGREYPERGQPEAERDRAGQLRAYLERAGLELLAVTRYRREGVLVVYLHGSAGQWAGGHALRLVRRAPGVLVAEESVSSPTIITARIAPPDPEPDLDPADEQGAR